MRHTLAILPALITAVLLGAGCVTEPRSRSLAWDVVNLKDDDGVGSPREAPIIEGEDLGLRGKEVRTRYPYSAPVTVEFDVMLEERLAKDGAMLCLFVPVTQTVDLDVERDVTVQFYYDGQGDAVSVYEQFQHRPTPQGKTWSRTPLSIKPGSWHHMKYEVMKDALRLTVDGQDYSSGGAVVPYDLFYIELSGWQPVNRWHVRGFSVH